MLPTVHCACPAYTQCHALAATLDGILPTIIDAIVFPPRFSYAFLVCVHVMAGRPTSGNGAAKQVLLVPNGMVPPQLLLLWLLPPHRLMIPVVLQRHEEMHPSPSAVQVLLDRRTRAIDPVTVWKV